jgi:hypothetical protein
MPIVEIREDHVRQRCAKCRSERDIEVGALASAAEAGLLDTAVLGLPACSCGSTEFLIRAPDGEPPHPSPGSFGHLHRMIVDALVDGLKERANGGQNAASLARIAEAQLGASLVAKWFPNGLKIDAPPEPRREGGKQGAL